MPRLISSEAPAALRMLINGEASFEQRLRYLREKGLYRSLKIVHGEQGPWVDLEGGRVLNLCSNNYLGIASHPGLKEAAAKAAYEYGCGSGSSRLICGSLMLHDVLEKRVAKFKGSEAALVYNSGYTANLGVISCVAGKGDFIFSDELNHASIIDGCLLSGANVIVFPHNDPAALEEKIRTSFDRNAESRRLIVVDGVFSMNGDLSPLPELVRIADRYRALLMVDEAHATGTMGPGGRGAVAHFGLEGKVDIIMGTFGKALGGFGAFVAGSRELIRYLINTCRSFIFTTALPPPVVASDLAALDVLESNPSLVTRLRGNAGYLRKRLMELGYRISGSQTPIIPVIIGEASLACEFSSLLLEEGIFAVPIRPPTVPEGQSRIRVTVMATHTLEEMEFALKGFDKVGRQLGII